MINAHMICHHDVYHVSEEEEEEEEEEMIFFL